MAILPGLFNINEPVIYGYPIVYNLPLMIPFVLLPDLTPETGLELVRCV